MNVMSEAVVTMHNMRLYQQVARYCVTSLSVCLSVCVVQKEVEVNVKEGLRTHLLMAELVFLGPAADQGRYAKALYLCSSVCLSVCRWLVCSFDCCLAAQCCRP